MHSNYRKIFLAIIACLLPFIAGCESIMPEPWVKPYERHYLADPIMSMERDPVAAGYMNHVYEAREAARGAEGGSGGGCGCN